MNNYNEERQNKKYKRKHSKKNIAPVPMIMPMNPQPMLYQNPMLVQPQPIYPITPAYPIMQPIPQMGPQPYVAVPVGPPRLAAIPVTRNVPVMTPVNKPKDANKKSKKKPIIIIKEYYKKEEDSCCSIF